MTATTPSLAPWAHRILTRVDAWAHQGVLRPLVVKVGVSVLGPLIVLVGIAMLVLPGPGLVVIALGAALLALEYQWARRVMRVTGSVLGRARRAVAPVDASPARKAVGLAATAGFLVVTTGATAAVTAFVGTRIV